MLAQLPGQAPFPFPKQIPIALLDGLLGKAQVNPVVHSLVIDGVCKTDNRCSNMSAFSDEMESFSFIRRSFSTIFVTAKRTGIPFFFASLALNMMDEVRANGGSVRVNELEEILGIPVVPISAAKNEGIEELIDHAIHVARHRESPGRVDFS